jgi:hypothetical protein
MQCWKYGKGGYIAKYCENLAEAQAELKLKGNKGQGQQSLNKHTSLMAITKDLGKPLQQWKIMS